MSYPKVIGIGTVALFALITLLAVLKKPEQKQDQLSDQAKQEQVIEIVKKEPAKKEEKRLENVPDIDLVSHLFSVGSLELPIVETITYTSRVPWLKDRPAWIADYAAHYSTSRHFIARSLNQRPEYFMQKASPGDRFNVLRKDLDLEFHLLIDLSSSKLWFYCYDKDLDEKVLLKVYNVGLGRKDSNKRSGCLTPVGKYKLGSKIAIYKKGTKGYFQDKKIEMLEVFGTRWMPFEKEIENCSERSKGFGLHGSPWKRKANEELEEDRSLIGKYDSDGCIRLNSEDIEEIFAIVITKPTIVELVKDVSKASIPGVEKKRFSRLQKSLVR